MSKKVLEFDLTGRECLTSPSDTLYLPYHGDVVAGMRFNQVFDYSSLPGDVLSMRLKTPKFSKVIVFVAEYPDVFLEDVRVARNMDILVKRQTHESK